MKSIQKTFSNIITWCSIESFVYQGILLGHQLFLYSHIDETLYGYTGTLFCILYFLVYSANLGFDSALSPFFVTARKNKNLFWNIVGKQCIINTVFLGIVAMVFIAAAYYNLFLLPFAIPLHIAAMIGILIITEGTKKTMRTILHLAFMNRKAALFEIATISIYTSAVWLAYICGLQFSANLLIIPMVITSTFSAIVLLLSALQFYRSLPKTNEVVAQGTYSRIVRARTFGFGNQLSHLMCSTNALVPLFAARFGLEYAGALRLFGDIAYTVVILFKKVFGVTSESLISYLKDKSQQAKHVAFSLLSRTMHHLLFGVACVAIASYRFIIGSHLLSTTHIPEIFLILLLLIYFTEALSITYESLFIAEEKAHYLLACNGVSLGLCTALITYSTTMSPQLLLVLVASIRIVSFVCLSISAFYHWQITPTIYMRPLYFVGAITASLICFYITP